MVNSVCLDIFLNIEKGEAFSKCYHNLGLFFPPSLDILNESQPSFSFHLNNTICSESLMSDHLGELDHEDNGEWLPLIEYSVKSGVSLSTIRRKIKTGTIPHRLEKGRYLILFHDMNRIPRQPNPTSSNDIGRWQDQPLHRVEDNQRIAQDPFYRDPMPMVETAVRLVSDAFERTLREKDERIRLLEKSNRDQEDRLNELRLLVRVLEEKFEVRY